ncbi:hypothetical protein CWO01_15970 [Vibrio splendidus]|uniref:hypothetical protein n=1 Tax=Vibrio splendidus TaxID=29497 RepID=UPI000D3CFDB6|nr:hypothetical protein [Vibrio splendidus]PTP60562.1 hypothetical protein CWO01_15970 [Vibrio splendidus]
MGKLLTECFYFSKSNIGSIFKIFGPYVIVTSLLSPFVELFYDSGNLFYIVVISSIHTYLMVRLIKFMAFAASGYPKEQTVSLIEWWRLLVVNIFYGLAVVLGCIALIVPGLYVAAKYGFAGFEAILNDKPAFSALNESWKDTKGIVGRLMMVTALICGTQLLIGFIFGLVGESSTLLYIVTEIFYGLISASIIIFSSVVYFRLYTEDRTGQEASLESEA